MIKLYGIPNCDTVKKARTWLSSHNINVEFHDFKKQGLNAELASHWLQQSPWEQLINRKGITWRGLTDEQKAISEAAPGNSFAVDQMLPWRLL